MVVVTIAAIVAAFAVPKLKQFLNSTRISGDAHNLAEEVTVAKMRAAADFTQARIHVDLAAQTYQLEACTKNVAGASTNCAGAGYSWLNANGRALEGPFPLSQGVTFGTAGVGAPPANTQTALGQAPPCRDSTPAAAVIANSACIIFNSRGLSVDGTANELPTSNNAFYITNGEQVFGVTVSTTGLIQTWAAAVNGSGFSAR
jgi:hypothetical protein